jgi:hypothetical protein
LAPITGLVGWNLDAEQVGHQAAGSIQLAGIDAGMHAKVVGARAQRHHNLFQRGVAGPFAQSVDGALHLPRAVEHAGSVLATAMPRSSWQCTLITARSMPGTFSRMLRISAPYCSGTV